MKLSLIYVSILISSSAAWAVSDKDLATSMNRVRQTLKTCEQKSVGTNGSEACFARGLKSAEDLLSRLYQQMLSTYGGMPEGGPEVARAFADGQKVWITYRNSHCAFVNSVLAPEFGDGGVMKSMCPYTETMRRLTSLTNLAPEITAG